MYLRQVIEKQMLFFVSAEDMVDYEKLKFDEKWKKVRNEYFKYYEVDETAQVPMKKAYSLLSEFIHYSVKEIIVEILKRVENLLFIVFSVEKANKEKAESKKNSSQFYSNHGIYCA